MKIYKPTYLYIKTHNSSGLKYFGKTTQDPFIYVGSGTRWKHHLEKYGYDVSTELLNNNNPYLDENELIKDAISFSITNNIVKSKDWANIRIECGDGGDTSMCDNYIKGMAARNMSGPNNPMWGKSSYMKGKTYEDLFGAEKAQQLKAERVKSSSGRKLSAESIKKMSESISRTTKGVPKSDQHKMNMRKPKTQDHKNKLKGPREKVECPYCKKVGGISQMKRWHYNNCNSQGSENENNQKRMH